MEADFLSPHSKPPSQSDRPSPHWWSSNCSTAAKREEGRAKPPAQRPFTGGGRVGLSFPNASNASYLLDSGLRNQEFVEVYDTKLEFDVGYREILAFLDIERMS